MHGRRGFLPTVDFDPQTRRDPVSINARATKLYKYFLPNSLYRFSRLTVHSGQTDRFFLTLSECTLVHQLSSAGVGTSLQKDGFHTKTESTEFFSADSVDSV